MEGNDTLQQLEAHIPATCQARPNIMNLRSQLHMQLQAAREGMLLWADHPRAMQPGQNDIHNRSDQ
jgi:hypothetical protein